MEIVVPKTVGRWQLELSLCCGNFPLIWKPFCNRVEVKPTFISIMALRQLLWVVKIEAIVMLQHLRRLQLINGRNRQNRYAPTIICQEQKAKEIGEQAVLLGIFKMTYVMPIHL
ncbi:hypothetical protein AVEN_219921-1 [Araneus ventricosus]|uniref:Uncharacterized protein n=1 Tax=Araneus ventricosus TaxID=182803 RepID=A0A4Y2T2Y7_ARAVE|nr:hypothetical protein AVEN_219921-1 [Araneus ventricosus]